MLDSEIDCIISLLRLGQRNSFKTGISEIVGWKKRFLELVFLLHRFPSSLTYEKLALLTCIHPKFIMIWMHNMRTNNIKIMKTPKTIKIITFYYNLMTPMERRLGNISYKMLVNIFILVVRGF
ncbi:Homeobox protein HD-11 [Dictyocoela muelleri]|nr:Homeobox protein HD-11 [Dictyocoela muelleri]